MFQLYLAIMKYSIWPLSKQLHDVYFAILVYLILLLYSHSTMVHSLFKESSARSITLLLLLFVWPLVGDGFLSPLPRLQGPKGQPPKFSQREKCLGGPEESLCWSTMRTTFSHKPGYTGIIPDVGDTVL